LALENVWDEREELFNVGDDEDEYEEDDSKEGSGNDDEDRTEAHCSRTACAPGCPARRETGKVGEVG
jgi:hypothetical protein